MIKEETLTMAQMMIHIGCTPGGSFVATSGVTGVVFIIVGVDGIGVVGRERREGGVLSSIMIVVWAGGRVR